MASKRIKKKREKQRAIETLQYLPTNVKEALQLTGRESLYDLQQKITQAKAIIAQTERRKYIERLGQGQNDDDESRSDWVHLSGFEQHDYIAAYYDMMNAGLIEKKTVLDKYEAGQVVYELEDDEQRERFMRSAVERGKERAKKDSQKLEARKAEVRAKFGMMSFGVEDF